MNLKPKHLTLLFSFSLIFSQTTIGQCQSLSIDQAVQMALQNNLDIKIASQKENQAQAELNGTKAKYGFTITLGNTTTVSNGADAHYERDNNTSVSATYPLYTAGKKQLNTAIKEQSMTQSTLNTQRTIENIKYDTVKAYYDILEAQQNIDVDQESVNNYDKHLTNVQQLYSAGSVPKSDLLRSEVALSNAKQDLIKARNSYDISVITFKNIIKMNRDEPLQLTDTFRYIPFDYQMPYCLSYAADNRKDLTEAKLDYEIAQKNVELAKADYKPTVDASVSSNWDKQVLPSDMDHDYTIGVSASWNVFDNGLTKANVNAAEAELNQAQLTLQQKNDSIDLEVRQAYLNMQEAEKRFNSTQTAVAQAEEDFFIAQEKYRVGAGTTLDVTDAQLALSTARLNYISAQYDYARYKAELENTMGLDDDGETIK
ncbi:TolC family protein [Pectinatus frisingensis]|jgi:outer membrane protein TolC|uniref:TolC family protein n=1 Tax=Pectinatus frisingensis TaxID=865 RepID=UPI0015F58476|nr:TolC family protein [Pectinatus frisingensis]